MKLCDHTTRSLNVGLLSQRSPLAYFNFRMRRLNQFYVLFNTKKRPPHTHRSHWKSSPGLANQTEREFVFTFQNCQKQRNRRDVGKRAVNLIRCISVRGGQTKKKCVGPNIIFIQNYIQMMLNSGRLHNYRMTNG